MIVPLVAGGAALALAAAWRLHPRRFVRPLRALNRRLSRLSARTLAVDGHEVHYLEGGRGETVLLLHGIFAEKDHWAEFARRLTPRYHVVALDLPGFGDSTRRDDASYAYPEQVRRIEAIAAVLRLPPAHVAGNSMGGALATRWAVVHPGRVRSLAYIGAPHGIPTPQPSEMQRRIVLGQAPLVARSRADYDEMLALLFHRRPWFPRPLVEDAAERLVAQADSNRRVWDEHREFDDGTAPLLPALDVPLYVQWGGEERIFHPSGADEIRRLRPDARVEVLPGVGHLPMLERPRESADRYLAFLRSLPAAAPVPSSAEHAAPNGPRRPLHAQR